MLVKEFQPIAENQNQPKTENPKQPQNRPKTPQIQEETTGRLKPLPAICNPPKIDFNLDETLAKLEIPKIMKSFFQNCTSEEEVVQAYEKREETLKKIHREDQQRKFEEEIKRRQDIIKSAKIPKIFSTTKASDFKITDNNENAAKTAIDAITNNAGIFLYGECGTGKTMLASIIANERATLFKSSMFIGAVDIFQELNPYSSDGRIAATRKSILKNSPCLIIDDLGAEKPSDWTKQILFEIIDFRYRENLQTIITSNFSVNALLSNGRLTEYEGKRIIRRIKSICDIIELKHF